MDNNEFVGFAAEQVDGNASTQKNDEFQFVQPTPIALGKRQLPRTPHHPQEVDPNFSRSAETEPYPRATRELARTPVRSQETTSTEKVQTDHEFDESSLPLKKFEIPRTPIHQSTTVDDCQQDESVPFVSQQNLKENFEPADESPVANVKGQLYRTPCVPHLKDSEKLEDLSPPIPISKIATKLWKASEEKVEPTFTTPELTAEVKNRFPLGPHQLARTPFVKETSAEDLAISANPPPVANLNATGFVLSQPTHPPLLKKVEPTFTTPDLPAKTENRFPLGPHQLARAPFAKETSIEAEDLVSSPNPPPVANFNASGSQVRPSSMEKKVVAKKKKRRSELIQKFLEGADLQELGVEMKDLTSELIPRTPLDLEQTGNLNDNTESRLEKFIFENENKLHDGAHNDIEEKSSGEMSLPTSSSGTSSTSPEKSEAAVENDLKVLDGEKGGSNIVEVENKKKTQLEEKSKVRLKSEKNPQSETKTEEAVPKANTTRSKRAAAKGKITEEPILEETENPKKIDNSITSRRIATKKAGSDISVEPNKDEKQTVDETVNQSKADNSKTSRTKKNTSKNVVDENAAKLLDDQKKNTPKNVKEIEASVVAEKPKMVRQRSVKSNETVAKSSQTVEIDLQAVAKPSQPVAIDLPPDTSTSGTRTRKAPIRKAQKSNETTLPEIVEEKEDSKEKNGQKNEERKAQPSKTKSATELDCADAAAIPSEPQKRTGKRYTLKKTSQTNVPEKAEQTSVVKVSQPEKVEKSGLPGAKSGAVSKLNRSKKVIGVSEKKIELPTVIPEPIKEASVEENSRKTRRGKAATDEKLKTSDKSKSSEAKVEEKMKPAAARKEEKALIEPASVKEELVKKPPAKRSGAAATTQRGGSPRKQPKTSSAESTLIVGTETSDKIIAKTRSYVGRGSKSNGRNETVREELEPFVS